MFHVHKVRMMKTWTAPQHHIASHPTSVPYLIDAHSHAPESSEKPPQTVAIIMKWHVLKLHMVMMVRRPETFGHIVYFE